jgi:hypothetical protein
MKKLRVLIQVSMMIAMAAGIFRDDVVKIISFSLLFIFTMYIYPRIVIFIAKKFGAKPSTTGYDGEITITKPKGDEAGSIAFKLYSEPDALSSKDEVCLLIKNE